MSRCLRRGCGAPVSFTVIDLKRNPGLSVKHYASCKHTHTHTHVLHDTHTETCQYQPRNELNYVNILIRRT